MQLWGRRPQERKAPFFMRIRPAQPGEKVAIPQFGAREVWVCSLHKATMQPWGEEIHCMCGGGLLSLAPGNHGYVMATFLDVSSLNSAAARPLFFCPFSSHPAAIAGPRRGRRHPRGACGAWLRRLPLLAAALRPHSPRSPKCRDPGGRCGDTFQGRSRSVTQARRASQQAMAQAAPSDQPASTSVGQWTPR